MGAGGGLEGHAVHADDGTQRLLESPHQLERALDALLVLVRVQAREPGQGGRLLVEHRVVLHRAAAERVEVLADRVVQRGQAAVVAHDLGLAEPGQARRARAKHLSRQHVRRGRAGDVGLRKPRRVDRGAAELEAEWFSHYCSAATSSSSARASFTSVQVNVSTPLSSRNHRLTSRPPRIPFRASFLTTEDDFGTRIGNSFTNCRSGNASSQPGRAASLSARLCARLKLTSATWRSPYGPM